jgi:hypothetical protein
MKIARWGMKLRGDPAREEGLYRRRERNVILDSLVKKEG